MPNCALPSNFNLDASLQGWGGVLSVETVNSHTIRVLCGPWHSSRDGGGVCKLIIHIELRQT
jgi:hypothetical protein